MKIRTSSIGAALLLVLAGPALSNLFRNGSASAQTVNKPSIQITLRTHKLYMRGAQRDEDTWSWSPRIVYRVVGPISAGSQLSVEYTLPSGKAWIKHDCPTQATKDGYWSETQCGINSNDVPDEQASIETGVAQFKIVLKNELESTNKTLFAGKFKVEKFYVGVVDLPKFKNNFSYYVNYDWALPIGYLYDYDIMDFRVGYTPSSTEGRLTFVTWFKGTPNTLDYAKYAAYLYYQGKVVADSTGEDNKYGNTGCEVTNTAYEESAFGYCRRKFVVNAMVWDKQPEFHPRDFAMYKNPGEYEIRVLQNGKLVRTAKFTMGTNYQLVDTGIGKQNNLGTGRVVVPVQILGDQDGQWDRNAYKAEAFFGNPLSGFPAP